MNLNLRRQLSGNIRLALLFGFGGLIALLAFLGVYATSALARVRQTESETTRQYILRHDRLETVRGAAYTASARLRNYLIDPDPAALPRHAEQARDLWARANTALAQYRQAATAARQPLAAHLQSDFDAYWNVAQEAFAMSEAQRRESGYGLLDRQLGPLRVNFLATIDQIRTQDQLDMRERVRESGELLDGLHRSLLIAIAVSLLLGLGLAVLTWRYLMRLEAEARARYAESIEAAAQLESLSRRLIEVQEQERRSLSRELHDEVAQSVGALLMDLGQARKSEPAPDLDERLRSAVALGESTLRAVRDMSLLLRPSMLDDLGLIPALNWEAREIQRRHGIQTRVDTGGLDDIELSDDVRTTAYRLVQEALRNIARHSEATEAEIAILRRAGNSLRIVVRDNGKGFDPAKTKGLGLLGMQERVGGLNGNLQITSAPGQGSVLTIDIPFA
ncbi:MAG: MCP four helix bundle domain-containing protein [Acidobacteria bacterium]|nr:MCP four helix bundle domain-containing protein [Acidobacteriota bacterium]